MCSEYTWWGIRDHQLSELRIRSSPCYSNTGFEIDYICKEGLKASNKSSVSVDTPICSLGQVIENWSHLCKLYNYQKKYGSVTPETSTVIRHNFMLEAADTLSQNWGSGGLRMALQRARFPVAGLKEMGQGISSNDGNQKPLCFFQTNQNPFRSRQQIIR